MKSVGDFCYIQQALLCTHVEWKIQNVICSLRYAVKGGNALHATNQSASSPAATEEGKDIARMTSRQNIRRLWTDKQVSNIQAELLPMAAQGTPASITDLQKQSNRSMDK